MIFKKHLFIFSALIFSFFSAKSQSISLKGNVKDTLLNLPVENALVMATRLNDSTLVTYTRTNNKGNFNLKLLKPDTLLLIIGANNFSDQYVLFLPDNKAVNFDLGEIILPPQTVEIREIVIKAYTDPMFTKGDTLVFLADSFKVRQNATVEDLLKKLPGVKVDNSGKVTVQGKKVDKILVDGDEFFGKDPNIALKNLGADAVESVQVYDKKNETGTNANGEENEKILDLKLKESAKKGYFGKVGAGSDSKKYYEGEALFNRFTGLNKISFFYKGGNTPNTSLSWEDMDEYGLNNEQTFLTGDDGMMFMDRDNLGDGYPVNHKSGIYLNQTINKKLKVNGNYTYSYSSLLKKTTRASQYFLKDSSFTTRETEIAEIVNKKNNFNLSLELKADSLTKLSIRNQFVKLDGSNASNLSQDYNTNENITFRNSQTNNNNANEKTNNEFTAIVQRKFKKKDRELRANYNLTSTENQSNENFNQNNSFYTQNFSPLLTNQKSKEKNQLQSHLISVNYEEPITKKIKYLAGVLAGTSNEGKNRQVNNLASDGNYYNNPFFTNSFETRRTMTTVSNALNYSTKKIGLSAGVDVRKLNLDNINLLNQKNIQQNAVNALPKVFFRYSLGSNQSIYIRYNMNANLPKINYIQPIPSSLNTNSLTIGNPNLVQSITNSVNANFWVYKAISNFYYGLSANATQKNNDFALNTTYDSIGRSINKYENIQGNYSAGLSGWLNKPFFNKTLTVNIDGNVYQSVNYNFINRIKNRTEYNTLGANPGITFTKELIEVSVNGGYSYNFSKSTLYNKSNIPYAAYNAGGHINIYATKRFIIKTDVNYKVNTRRNNGYNVNLFIWNASVMYNFLKEENFSVTVDAFDILNNNLLINRNIYGNVVSDTRTAVIARYFLLSVTYRFKNQGAKKEDEVFVD